MQIAIRSEVSVCIRRDPVAVADARVLDVEPLPASCVSPAFEAVYLFNSGAETFALAHRLFNMSGELLRRFLK